MLNLQELNGLRHRLRHYSDTTRVKLPNIQFFAKSDDVIKSKNSYYSQTDNVMTIINTYVNSVSDSAFAGMSLAYNNAKIFS